MIESLTKDNINIIDNSFINQQEVINNFTNNPYARYLVYINNKQILGYIYYSDIYDRTEINMIEVKKEFRNRQIGSELLQEYLKITNKPSTLEVKKNNSYAIKLYTKYDYKQVAIRKKYYKGIDGLLMERK